MIIRDGFVTNSSSTNFLIISKEELTTSYLMEKLGFKKNSAIAEAGISLADDIIFSTAERGVRWYELDQLNYESILGIYGKESADKYKVLSTKGYHTYVGYISSDDDYLTAFMTMDSFVIDDMDFYMDGRNCVW